MKIEQEEGPKLNPFEKLGVLYEETFDPSDRFLRGRVNLENNIVMLISPRPWNGDPVKSLEVHFFSKVKDGLHGSGFGFDINQDGSLERITFPLTVAIGGKKYKEFRDGRVIAARSEDSVEDRIAWAEILLDWLDKVVEKNEFSDPPITARKEITFSDS